MKRAVHLLAVLGVVSFAAISPVSSQSLGGVCRIICVDMSTSTRHLYTVTASYSSCCSRVISCPSGMVGLTYTWSSSTTPPVLC